MHAAEGTIKCNDIGYKTKSFVNAAQPATGTGSGFNRDDQTFIKTATKCKPSDLNLVTALRLNFSEQNRYVQFYIHMSRGC